MVIVQLLVTAAACLGLWRLCRAQPKIVIAGFLVRALAGQALFWISYLRLPFARSLQLGNGFWFFAVDGPFYLGYANELASRGPAAILFDARYPSQFFVQVLSLCAGAFGSVASVAILLNCAAYLATCEIIARIARPRNNVVLAAIACSPAGILFSLQPLKDTLFTLLIVAMIAAFRRWEESWQAGGKWARFFGYALAMCAVIFAVAGIRWYVSVIAWGAAGIFFVLTALQANRKGWAFTTGALLLVLLAQSIRLGAHDLQPAYARLLNPMTVLQWRPSAAQRHLATVKRGFESTPGATTVAAGGALPQTDTTETSAPAQAEITPPEPASLPPSPPAVTTIAESRAPADSPPPPSTPVTVTTTTIAESSVPEPPKIAPTVVVSPPPSTPAKTTIAKRSVPAEPKIAPLEPVSPPATAPETATTIAESVAPAEPEIAPVVPASPRTTTQETTTETTTIGEISAPAPPKITPPEPVSPSPATSTTTIATAAEGSSPSQPVLAPVAPATSKPRSSLLPSWTSRVITGFSAMFLPRFLGEALGLIRVGGGRGLWLFAEVDTILFDLVLLYALVYCVRNLWTGRAKMTATFVFCVLVFVMTAGPMLYTVNNFGTLFRLRLMVYCIAAVLPITLRETGDAVQ